MEKILKWIIRKLVTLYWHRYSFLTYSWGVDENVDLNIISEEFYSDSHRYGVRVEKYGNSNQ